jgi:hypothetical protein
MGSFSSIAIAIRSKPLNAMLKTKSGELIQKCFNMSTHCYEEDSGSLYHYSSIKWYGSSYINALMKALNRLNSKNYLFIKIDEEGMAYILGEWNDNPWKLTTISKISFKDSYLIPY